MHIYSQIDRLLGGMPNVTFLEVGCHRCEDTRRILELLNSPQYHCFEPDPRNAEAIRKHPCYPQIVLHEQAVADFEGETEMFLSGGTSVHSPVREWTSSSSILKPTNHLELFPHVKFGDTAKVEVITLDGFVARSGLKSIDFVWADAQGAEVHMIKGGQEALRRTKYLYSEFSNDRWYEGQVGLEEWLPLLPGRWETVELYDGDILLENKDYRQE